MPQQSRLSQSRDRHTLGGIARSTYRDGYEDGIGSASQIGLAFLDQIQKPYAQPLR
jgi:hypothetical protein